MEVWQGRDRRIPRNASIPLLRPGFAARSPLGATDPLAVSVPAPQD